MKNLNLMKILTILSAALLLQTFTASSAHAQASACTTTSGSSSGAECTLDVKSFRLKVYEFSLCTGFATVADRSLCTTLYSNSAGYDLTLSKTASLPLGGDVSLTAGTYTHAYIIVHKNTFLKSVHEFSTNREDMGGNTGKFCYSNGTIRTEDSSFNLTNQVVTCSNSDLSAENKETIKFDNGSGGYSNISISDPTSGGVTSTGYTKLYALKTISPAVAGTAWATDTAILASQKINPVTIGPLSSGLDIAFTVTKGIALEFLQGQSTSGGGDTCGAANSAYCAVDLGWLGMVFKVSAD